MAASDTPKGRLDLLRWARWARRFLFFWAIWSVLVVLITLSVALIVSYFAMSWGKRITIETIVGLLLSDELLPLFVASSLIIALGLTYVLSVTLLPRRHASVAKNVYCTNLQCLLHGDRRLCSFYSFNCLDSC